MIHVYSSTMIDIKQYCSIPIDERISVKQGDYIGVQDPTPEDGIPVVAYMYSYSPDGIYQTDTDFRTYAWPNCGKVSG